MNDLTEFFGEPISVYTRAQALADGVLVDVSRVIEPCPFKFPVAMTQAAWEATVAAGGEWVPCELIGGPAAEMADAGTGASEELRLPNGQDIKGRMHDVFQRILWEMRRTPGPTSRINFSVLVDVHGNGRRSNVEIYSVCGPGDKAEPVITIMLRGED